MECGDVPCYRESFDPGGIDRHKFTPTSPQMKDNPIEFISFFCVCLQDNCMSVPVVYLDPMLDQELASRLATIITKHQVIKQV